MHESSNKIVTERDKLSRDRIIFIGNKIKENYEPRKVILFGSYAWGKPDSESDIDLLVVMDSKLRRDKRSRELQKLFPDRTFSLDIIVYTPEEIEESLEKGNTFIREVMTKGQVL